jgi:hypothetical protein
MPTPDVSGDAVAWLLDSGEPAVRGMARRDLLGEPEPDDLRRVMDGPLASGLLAGQQPDGGFGGHPYRKWTGLHWRLVSLVELEARPTPPVLAAVDRELDWLTGRGRLDKVVRVHGLPLSDASIEGNGLAVTCRLGRASDHRAVMLADALLAWQWPDGGWNCDARASGRRSSFHESLIPMWALWEYGQATGDPHARAAATRTAELLLEHRLFRRHGSGGPIHSSWTKLHYPAYWHYDILQALHLLARMGLARDERASDALDVIEARRTADGRWRPGAYWWASVGGNRAPEAVDWGRGRPSEMTTLNALRVLRQAGRA